MVNISGMIRISLHQFINIAIQDKMQVFAEIVIAYLHHQLKKMSMVLQVDVIDGDS